jgi:hypothetical protein
LEEGYDDWNCLALVHSGVMHTMQGEFAELHVTIVPTANDFPIRKALLRNLQKNLQRCSNSEMCECDCGIILQLCGFGMHV